MGIWVDKGLKFTEYLCIGKLRIDYEETNEIWIHFKNEHMVITSKKSFIRAFPKSVVMHLTLISHCIINWKTNGKIFY